MSDTESEALAERLCELWARHTGGEPGTWHHLPERKQRAWIAVARCAVEKPTVVGTAACRKCGSEVKIEDRPIDAGLGVAPYGVCCDVAYAQLPDGKVSAMDLAME